MQRQKQTKKNELTQDKHMKIAWMQLSATILFEVYIIIRLLQSDFTSPSHRSKKKFIYIY